MMREETENEDIMHPILTDGVRGRTTSEQFVYKCDTRVVTLHNRAIQKLVHSIPVPLLFCFTPSSVSRNNGAMNERLCCR